MAPRKKISRPAGQVRVRARVSFNGLHRGDEGDVIMNEVMQGWIDAGLMEVIDGTGEAGPGGAEPDAHERVADGAAGSGEAGSEPGEGFGAGAYGAPSKLDPS